MAKLILIHSGLNQEMSKHIIGASEFANVFVIFFSNLRTNKKNRYKLIMKRTDYENEDKCLLK